jgi:hypothetical protein
MTDDREGNRRQNFEATWRSQDLDRLLKAIAPIMRLSPKKRDRLLRDYRVAPFDDDDEMDLREKLDFFLHGCSVLEVGFKAGVLSDPEDRCLKELRPVLSDPQVQLYFGPDRYPLVLPGELLARLTTKGAQPEDRFEPAWFGKLLAMNDRFRDPQLDDFLSLVDSFWIEGFHFQKLRKIATDRDAIVKALITPQADRKIDQRALVGLERFLFFCADLVDIIAEAPRADLGDAAFNLYRYWFSDAVSDNVDEVVEGALNALADGGSLARLPERKALRNLFARAA